VIPLTRGDVGGHVCPRSFFEAGAFFFAVANLVVCVFFAHLIAGQMVEGKTGAMRLCF
jgi:hypothetical protein